MTGRVRVFIASSLDGFIAGPDDDLTWLPQPSDGDDFGYGAFMQTVGALLMGRKTYDVVAGFSGEWPYGDHPVLVATHRPLAPKVSSVAAVNGSIDKLVKDALWAAGGKDVYLDGGNLIRQALTAGLVDELIVTLAPIILGAGRPLFAGTPQRIPLQFYASHPLAGGMMQLTYRLPRQKAL